MDNQYSIYFQRIIQYPYIHIWNRMPWSLLWIKNPICHMRTKLIGKKLQNILRTVDFNPQTLRFRCKNQNTERKTHAENEKKTQESFAFIINYFSTATCYIIISGKSATQQILIMKAAWDSPPLKYKFYRIFKIIYNRNNKTYVRHRQRIQLCATGFFLIS